MVTDKWVEVGNNTDGVDHVVAANISIAVMPTMHFAQRIHGVAHDTNRQQSLADDWFHDVELQLPASRHSYGLVIAEDLKQT